MTIDKNELKTRLWAEWANGLKLLGESLGSDRIKIINSACTMALGNENFIQRAVMCVQRKTWIGKFKDYKSRIAAYETSIVELVDEVNKLIGDEKGPWYKLGASGASPKIAYASALGDIIIDGDDRFDNADWGDHAIAAYEKLFDYVSKMIDVLSKAQDALDK